MPPKSSPSGLEGWIGSGIARFGFLRAVPGAAPRSGRAGAIIPARIYRGAPACPELLELAPGGEYSLGHTRSCAGREAAVCEHPGLRKSFPVLGDS